MPAPTHEFPALYLRIVLPEGIRFGPGKADLLEGIEALGSIAGAGRRMRMSYKRAWELVGELNRCFDAPLVDASKGGSGGGGARLTPLGGTMLKSYRAMQAASRTAVRGDLARMRRHMKPSATRA
jgi:molybdate transport system regulatory protein